MYISKTDSLDRKIQTNSFGQSTPNEHNTNLIQVSTKKMNESEKDPSPTKLGWTPSDGTSISNNQSNNKNVIDNQVIKQFVLTSSSQEEREMIIKTMDITERQIQEQQTRAQTRIQVNTYSSQKEPKVFLSKEIKFKKKETLPPIAPIGYYSTEKKKLLTKREYEELVKPMQQSGYFNIVEKKSYSVNKNDPYQTSTYIPLKGDFQRGKYKSKSLSHLLMGNKAKVIKRKRYSSNTQKVNSPKKNVYNNQLNESENHIIITRAMRNEKGGVVDLGSLDKEKRIKTFTISTFQNKDSLSPKEKEKNAKIIQRWLRNIMQYFHDNIEKIIKIQSTFRMFYYRNFVFSKIYEKYMNDLKINKLIIPFENIKKKILHILKNYIPIKINKIQNEKLKYIDWLLKSKILLQKQKVFDIVRQRSLVNKIKIKVRKFTNMVEIVQKKNTNLNGNEIIENLRNNYKKKKLKDATEKLENNKLKKNLRQFDRHCYGSKGSQQSANLRFFVLVLEKKMKQIYNKTNKYFIDKFSNYETKPKRLLRAKPKLLKRINEIDDIKKLFVVLYWKRWIKKMKSLQAKEAARRLQQKAKRFLTEKKISIIRMYIISQFMKFPFDKIIQEAKRRTLIKGLLVIRSCQLKKLIYSFSMIKEYSKFTHMIRNTGATIIQHKFLNAYPEIKKKRKLREKIKNFKVSREILIQSIIKIQKWFKTSRYNLKINTINKLREIFISHFLYLNFKPYLRKFLLLYRLTKGKKYIERYIFKIFEMKI